MAYMRANVLLWLVPASIVMAFGVTISITAIIDHHLTIQIARPDIIAISGICGIAFGLMAIVLGYSSEMNAYNKMKTIFRKAKLSNSGLSYNKDSEKKIYLGCVSHNTLQLTKKLATLGNLIRRYSEETPPKDWQIVRYNAARSKQQIEELCKRIILDFAQIVDLIENPHLVDLYGIKTLYHSLDLIDQTLRIDPEIHENLLRELRREIREQIALLEKALELINQEKKTTNDG